MAAFSPRRYLLERCCLFQLFWEFVNLERCLLVDNFSIQGLLSDSKISYNEDERNMIDRASAIGRLYHYPE